MNRRVVSVGERLVIGIHGQSGSGKTTLAATAAPPEQMVWLSFDRGGCNVIKAAGLYPEEYDIPTLLAENPVDLPNLVAWALGDIEKLFKAGKKTHLVIDTLSTFATQRLNALASVEAKQAKPNAWAPYQAVGRELIALVTVATTFAPNVIICSHSKVNKEDEASDNGKALKGLYKIVMDIPGNQAWNTINGALDLGIAIKMSKGNSGGRPSVVRKLLVEDTDYACKTRFPVLAKKDLPFDLGAIIRMIKDGG